MSVRDGDVADTAELHRVADRPAVETPRGLNGVAMARLSWIYRPSFRIKPCTGRAGTVAGAPTSGALAVGAANRSGSSATAQFRTTIRRQLLETIRGLRRRPTVRASRLDDVGPRIYVKYEGSNPTGSFKDHGTAFGLSAALAAEGELASDDDAVATGRGFGGTEAMNATD